MANVINQIISDNADTQTIQLIVRSSERGPQGEQGIPGVSATIEAGNAYSVPFGQEPSVINTGSTSAAVFDFYIPKGEKGDTGVAPITMTTVDPGENTPLEENHFIAVYTE